MWGMSNDLYHKIFTPYLSDGSDTIECTLDEFQAGYDKFLGIDVLLSFKNGMTLTMQEKFLTTRYDTVTVEYYNNPRTGDTGDWFDLKAQLYFVGYWDKNKSTKGFHKWILLDWVRVVAATQKELIPWQEQGNNHSAARASFKFVGFHAIPDSCIIAKKF